MAEGTSTVSRLRDLAAIMQESADTIERLTAERDDARRDRDRLDEENHKLRADADREVNIAWNKGYDAALRERT